MTRFTLSLVLCGTLLAGSLAAQVSTQQIVVGGPGATGCSGGVMENGQPATATVDFTYDASTQVLSLLVTNTSPLIAGLAVPVITRIFFNLPQHALTGMTLFSQSAASGALTWQFAADVDLVNGSGLNAACMGDYGVRLRTSMGVNQAIANAAETANTVTSNFATGPASFRFNCTGPGAANLTAGAFASSLSSDADRANVVMHFQGGAGDGSASGWIANDEGCSPGGWVVGEPRIGSTIGFVQTAADGCFGCIIASVDPGPTVFGDLVAPIGLPFIVVTSALFPNGSGTNTQLLPVFVPNIPAIVGLTVYFTVVNVDLATLSIFSFSDQFTLTILPAI